MKSETPDRRVQRTRKMLHEALMSLVLEKKYEIISVQEILDRANVGRSTFYTHFKDKDDLLVKGFEEMRELLRTAQDECTSSDKSHEKIIGFSQTLFTHANDYRHIYRALIRSQAGPIVQQKIQTIIVNLIREEFEKELNRKKPAESKLPLELLIQYVGSVIFLVMTWWVDQKNALPPESINAMFRSLVLPTVEAQFS
jgi:AcrR family transcriptional regulator